jgi:hypothetical protein
MGNIYFNYEGEKYSIFFFPCGRIAEVTKLRNKNGNARTRAVTYPADMKVKDFMEKLKAVNFDF